MYGLKVISKYGKIQTYNNNNYLTIILLLFTFILFNMPSQSNNNSQRLTEVSNNVREAKRPNSITNSGNITVTKYNKAWRTIQNRMM